MQITTFRKFAIRSVPSNLTAGMILQDAARGALLVPMFMLAAWLGAGETRPHYSGECGRGGDIPEYDSRTKAEHEAALAWSSRCGGDAG